MVEHLAGHLDQSITLYRQAISENHRYGQAWLGFIQVLIEAGKGEDADKECGMFMLACSKDDGPLYVKARRLVDQYIRSGKTGHPAESNETWLK